MLKASVTLEVQLAERKDDYAHWESRSRPSDEGARRSAGKAITARRSTRNVLG
jgi:hypothetical protein